MTYREERLLERARSALSRVGLGSTLKDVFTSLSDVVPTLAGYVETYSQQKPWEVHHAPTGLPVGLSELMLLKKPFEPQEALGIVSRMRVGSLQVDSEALSPAAWEHVEGYQALRQHGFGSAAALKLRDSTGPSGREHTYIAFCLDEAGALHSQARALLRVLVPQVRGAIDRLAVPLLRGDHLMSQVALEQEFGVVAVTRHAIVRQANRMAYDLAVRYGAALRVTESRKTIGAFVEALLQAPRSPHDGRWQLAHPSQQTSRYLEVSFHALEPDAYGIPEPMWMLMMREIRPYMGAAAHVHDAIHELDDVERRIVRAMVDTHDVNKEIAELVRLTPRTLEKRVQLIATKLGIRVPRGGRVRPLLRRMFAE